MTNRKSNLSGFSNPNGLYRVWVSLHDDRQAPLIAIWIDPQMTAFKPEPLAEPAMATGMGGEGTAEEVEDARRGGLQWSVQAAC